MLFFSLSLTLTLHYIAQSSCVYKNYYYIINEITLLKIEEKFTTKPTWHTEHKQLLALLNAPRKTKPQSVTANAFFEIYQQDWKFIVSRYVCYRFLVLSGYFEMYRKMLPFIYFFFMFPSIFPTLGNFENIANVKSCIYKVACLCNVLS